MVFRPTRLASGQPNKSIDFIPVQLNSPSQSPSEAVMSAAADKEHCVLLSDKHHITLVTILADYNVTPFAGNYKWAGESNP